MKRGVCVNATRIISLEYIGSWLFHNAPENEPFWTIIRGLQFVRRLQGQDGEVDGEEVPATPKKIFQLLNQVNFSNTKEVSKL